VTAKAPLIGVGLRPTHFPYLESRPRIQTNFFEGISENFMNSEGRPLEVLLQVRADYPVALHGVAMSIGSGIGVNEQYLRKLKTLVDRVDPIVVSDHLCWAQTASGNTHDLLPMPLTSESLAKVVSNIEIVQDRLGRTILVENISYYLRFKESEIEETEFLTALCRKTGCQLLLDLNNVYVNAMNHGFNAFDYIRAIDPALVGQFHLAGPSQEKGFLFDTHSSVVPVEVWKLFEHVVQGGFRAPIIVEWDQDIPDFQTLEGEVQKARAILNGDLVNGHSQPTA
jgi:uncharacterized protein (UPF0276 family)